MKAVSYTHLDVYKRQAVDGGAIVDDGGVDLIRCVQHGGIDLDGDTGHTGSRLDLRAVGVPMQVLRAGVLAVQACFKGIGLSLIHISQNNSCPPHKS